MDKQVVSINGGHAVKDGDSLHLYRDVGDRFSRYHGFHIFRADLIKILPLFDIKILVENEKHNDDLPF